MRDQTSYAVDAEDVSYRVGYASGTEDVSDRIAYASGTEDVSDRIAYAVGADSQSPNGAIYASPGHRPGIDGINRFEP